MIVQKVFQQNLRNVQLLQDHNHESPFKNVFSIFFEII